MNIEYLRPASLRAVGFTSRKPADLFYKNHQRIPRGKPLDIIYCAMPLVLCFLFSALCLSGPPLVYQGTAAGYLLPSLCRFLFR